MAQRKPKESLIVEIPKPRLTDEELMEMFYGGERKNAPKVEKEETKSDSFQEISALLPEESTRKKEEEDKPSLQKPLIEEPFNNKPFLQEPYSQEPIKEEFLGTERLSAHSESPSSGFFPKPVEAEIITRPHDPRPHSETDEDVSVRSSQGGNLMPLDSRKADPNLNNSAVKAEVKTHIGSPEEGLPKKGSFQEGSFDKGFTKEGSTSLINAISPGETLKKAFDVLPMLSPLEQLMYLWFLNMSHEVGRESCRATMSLLQRATGISEKLVRDNIRSLLRNGCLHLLDGGAAGKAALYRVVLPEEAAEEIIKIKGYKKEGSPGEPSREESTEQLIPTGNLPKRNLPSHIERESFSYTLSKQMEPSSKEPFSREGSLPFSLPVKIADNVIDRFYSMTGQTRISRQKRERSRLQLLDLMQQGFQVDDVLYAIEWARGNISGPIHSFGLIPEIIGQAISKRPNPSTGQKPRPERSPHQRSSKSDAEVEKEQKEHERLEAIFTALSSEEQNALRSEALHLVESEYGSHVPGQQTLVRIKLMEILRDRYAEQGLPARKGG